LDVGLYCVNMDNLRDFPNLTDLILRPFNEPEDFDSSVDCISLAKLQSLSIAVDSLSIRGVRILEIVFSTFTLPSLTELIVHLEDEDSMGRIVWSSPAFDTFFSRSSCSLTTLSISGVLISDLELITALHLLPSLLNFSVDDRTLLEAETPITPYFILRLHGPVASKSPDPLPSPHLLPKLRSLSIIFHGTFFDDSVFVNMVSSRWLPDPSSAAAARIDCLRSVVLHFRAREVNEEVYSPLSHLDRMGMQVVVSDKI